MYKNHFGLERRIFRGNTAGADVFVGPQTANVVQGIKTALSAPDAVVTLTGPVGCGKSTAVAHSLGTISGRNAIVRVGRFPLQRGELLDLLFDHMRIQQRPQRGNQKLALFRTLLFNLAKNDSRMFVLVEDAPFLGPDMLAELEVVTAADTGPSDGAAIVLMGDDYLKELLASKPLARLRQRIRLRRSLAPCSTKELGGYLRHCFRQAGGDFDSIFAGSANELLHELSGGILRVVNNLVESSLEAAAEAKARTISLDLINRIADEEFGLTGKFTRLPEISSKQPEPRHSDDATAELVAVSMPGRQGAAGTANDTDDNDIPELIQDTQPALAILSDAPSVAKLSGPGGSHPTLPDIEAISAALDAKPALQERMPAPKPAGKTVAEQRTAPATGNAAGKTPAPQRKPAPGETPSPGSKPAPTSAGSERPASPPKPAPITATSETRAPDPEPATKPVASSPAEPEMAFELDLDMETEVASGLEPEAEPVVEPDLEQEPEPATDETIPTLLDSTGAIASPARDESTQDDTPAWDRDPTLAELRPDLDALERAMAVAHGRDPDAPEAAAPVPEPGHKKPPKEEIEDIPEITLDDSINRKVDMAALEKKKRLEKEGIVEEAEADAGEPEPSAEQRAREEKSSAELEKIAQGLARAKTIEDVDDKMAETLFGEELSVAAAAVAARVAEEAAAEAAKAGEDQTASSKSELEKEFENVWGETPAVEVSIDSEIEDQKGGMDISASQRLATVRALNTGSSGGAAAKAQGAPAVPAARPDPIEEQITTSLTQTLKALKVNPDPAAINDDDDDDDERKGGFFSRFRRS